MTIKSFLINVGFSSLACCCATAPGVLNNIAEAADTTPAASFVERDFYVKGMTCSGCEYGVKKALERAGVKKSDILLVEATKPDPANKIGHAKFRIPKDQYKGAETDCKIVKEIKDNPGYTAYWDKNNQTPCGS